MASDVHRVVQNSTYDDDQLARILSKSKEDDVPPSPSIAAYMQGVETPCDIGPSPDPDDFRTSPQRIEGRENNVPICVRLRLAEAIGRPAKDLSDISPGGLREPDPPALPLQPRRSASASRASNAKCSRNSSLVSKSR